MPLQPIVAEEEFCVGVDGLAQLYVLRLIARLFTKAVEDLLHRGTMSFGRGYRLGRRWILSAFAPSPGVPIEVRSSHPDSLVRR